MVGGTGSWVEDREGSPGERLEKADRERWRNPTVFLLVGFALPS